MPYSAFVKKTKQKDLHVIKTQLKVRCSPTLCILQFFSGLWSHHGGRRGGGWGSQKGCFLWSAWNWGRNGIFEFRSVKRMCLAVWEQFRLRRLQKEAAASLPPITLTRPIWSWNPVTRRSRSSAIHRTRSKLSVLEAVWIDRSKPLKWI